MDSKWRWFMAKCFRNFLSEIYKRWLMLDWRRYNIICILQCRNIEILSSCISITRRNIIFTAPLPCGKIFLCWNCSKVVFQRMIQFERDCEMKENFVLYWNYMYHMRENNNFRSEIVYCNENTVSNYCKCFISLSLTSV